ncbi:MAG: methylated-DNA--[protein]-cysteine S-methyltransferase [Bacteroidales bacterium]
MQVLNKTQIETPIGTMYACAVDEGICMLEFSDRKEIEKEFNEISKYFNSDINQSHNIHFDKLKIELNEYFEGKRKMFTVPLIFPGTEFQQLVLKGLQNIPYGSTISYKQQSIILNKASAIRAIAHSNGLNRISILIPCHRVIGENGKLTGYGGGLWRKKWLLDFENQNKQLKLEF